MEVDDLSLVSVDDHLSERSFPTFTTLTADEKFEGPRRRARGAGAAGR